MYQISCWNFGVQPSYGSTLYGLCPVSSLTSDNGQLLGATYTQGDPSFSQYLKFSQTYSYDNLNRLTQSVEGTNWGRGFDYDSFGNMWVDPSTSRTFGIPLAGNTPTSNVYNSKNQITGSSNYDGNGNRIAVNSASASYDSENHVINTTEPPSMGGYVDNYLYDGNGKRVEKVVNGATVVYVYDAFGDLDAEYTNLSASQITSPCYTPCYLTHDYLGSLRLLTDRRGNVVVARHDYLPFGEEIPAGTGGRTSQWGASNDGNIPTRFTGQLRDLETGLDYFGARYYGAALGRFTSADEPLADQNAEDPQSWNLYSYVRNNPLKNTDPSGQDCITTSDQTSSGVEVTTEQGGSVQTCSGTYVDGTVNTNSYQYNGTSLGYSFANATSSGAGTIQFGQEGSNDSLSPFAATVLSQAGAMAQPGVNLAVQGLRIFGYAVAAPAMLAAECVAGAPSCTGGNFAMALLPELGALKAGGTILEAGAAVGKAAEIIQKAGGIAQATKDFEALSGAESINGAVRIKTFSDGSRAVLYESTSGPVSIGIQDAAGRTMTKIRY